jgi:hypothetical protein
MLVLSADSWVFNMLKLLSSVRILARALDGFGLMMFTVEVMNHR